MVARGEVARVVDLRAPSRASMGDARDGVLSVITWDALSRFKGAAPLSSCRIAPECPVLLDPAALSVNRCVWSDR
jgi:hypothetical protein